MSRYPLSNTNVVLAYPFNRSSLGGWMLLVLACGTRGRRARSKPGSGPMPTVSIIWSGCAGLRVSRLQLAVDHDPVRYRDLIAQPQPEQTPRKPPVMSAAIRRPWNAHPQEDPGEPPTSATPVN